MAGLVLLGVGAEALVRGASGVARTLGLSPLVIGLTVVALGTSTPELAVSLHAGLTGQPDVAVGNVVGSNVFNVLLVLGLAALMVPLLISRRVVRREVPLMIAAALLLWLLSLDGRLGTLDGALLVAAMVAYVAWLIRSFRRDGKPPTPDAAPTAPPTPDAAAGEGPAHRPRSLPLSVVLAVAGAGVLVLGANWLVGGATDVARALGVSELMVGLTVVAGGTSLPEGAASLVAVRRGERNMAVGNIVGSNIFNVLVILGVAALVTPGGLEVAREAVAFDIPVMIAVCVACLPIFFTGHVIARWEGGLFLGFYGAYVVYLWLAATEHAALPAYGRAMWGFVIPLTAVTLGILAVRYWRKGPHAGRKGR